MDSKPERRNFFRGCGTMFLTGAGLSLVSTVGYEVVKKGLDFFTGPAAPDPSLPRTWRHVRNFDGADIAVATSGDTAFGPTYYQGHLRHATVNRAYGEWDSSGTGKEGRSAGGATVYPDARDPGFFYLKRAVKNGSTVVAEASVAVEIYGPNTFDHRRAGLRELAILTEGAVGGGNFSQRAVDETGLNHSIIVPEFAIEEIDTALVPKGTTIDTSVLRLDMDPEIVRQNRSVFEIFQSVGETIGSPDFWIMGLVQGATMAAFHLALSKGSKSRLSIGENEPVSIADPKILAKIKKAPGLFTQINNETLAALQKATGLKIPSSGARAQITNVLFLEDKSSVIIHDYKGATINNATVKSPVFWTVVC